MTAPARVCFLIDELAPAGTETQLLALIRHLDRRRVQPFLCLLRGEAEVSRALEPNDCHVLRLGVSSLRSPGAVTAAWRLGRFLRRERIDVLQVYFPDSTYFGVPVGWLARVPAVVRTRNNVGHWLTPLHRRLGRLLNRLTTATVANCEAARQSLLVAEKTPPHSVVVLENGVDLGRFDPVPPLSASRPLRHVGIVANLRAVKGLDVFLKATEMLASRYPDATFAVAGDGPEREALQHQADGFGLGDRLRLLGPVDDVPAFLSGIDVAVLCSRAEGMSNAVLEYMAAGRAVVATRVGANERMISDGVHGLLVPPGEARPLAEAIATLFDDPARACRLAAAARGRVEAEFSRSAMVRRFENFYAGLPRRPTVSCV